MGTNIKAIKTESDFDNLLLTKKLKQIMFSNIKNKRFVKNYQLFCVRAHR